MIKLEDYKIDKDQADYLLTIKCRAYEGDNVFKDVELVMYVIKDVYSIEDEEWYKLVGDYVKENVPKITSYSIKLKEIDKNNTDWFSSYSKVDDFLFKQLDTLGKEFPIVDMDRPELNTIEAIKVLNNVLLIEWENRK
tara:strand:+ start:60 stop:473 length:414 start_codon:yes stop_codon:yes gene_type:complete